MSEYLDKVFSPAKLGQLELRNRIIKAATYEGRAPNGCLLYTSDAADE